MLLLTGFLPLESLGQESINWVSIEVAEEKAAEDGKKILIDMYTDWCGWCKRMDAVTYTNEQVISFINENFHAVKFDAEQKEEVEVAGHTFKFVPQGRRGYHELAASLLQGQLSYPTTTFLSSDFKLIYNVPGFLDAKKMGNILAFTQEEAFKHTTFPEFEAAKNKAN
ncbi:MAG: DUF255 domain-containing protein [Bacteroidota bacterium]